MDKLSLSGIKSHICDSNIVIEFHEEVTSTNDMLMECAKHNQEGYTIVAGKQTKGKGRLDRSFYSPENSGAYFSILLKPDISATDPTILTALAGVAVCEAIEATTNEKPKIKWVNDVYIGNKKVCGILAQASLPDYIVVGIGINIYEPDNNFPTFENNVAGAICNNRHNGLMDKLTASVINNYFKHYNSMTSSNFIQNYKDYSMVIGKTVTVHIGSEAKSAYVMDIDEKCRLIVKYSNGEVEKLSSGEISIRL